MANLPLRLWLLFLLLLGSTASAWRLGPVGQGEYTIKRTSFESRPIDYDIDTDDPPPAASFPRRRHRSDGDGGEGEGEVERRSVKKVERARLLRRRDVHISTEGEEEDDHDLKSRNTSDDNKFWGPRDDVDQSALQVREDRTRFLLVPDRGEMRRRIKTFSGERGGHDDDEEKGDGEGKGALLSTHGGKEKSKGARNNHHDCHESQPSASAGEDKKEVDKRYPDEGDETWGARVPVGEDKKEADKRHPGNDDERHSKPDGRLTASTSDNGCYKARQQSFDDTVPDILPHTLAVETGSL